MKFDRRHLWLATLLVLASFGVASSQEGRLGQHASENWDYSPFPAPDNGYVTDLADLLTEEEEERIEVWLWQAESRTGIEIAVVTVPSFRQYPGAPSSSIEAFVMTHGLSVVRPMVPARTGLVDATVSLGTRSGFFRWS